MNQNSQPVHFLGGTYIDKGQNRLWEYLLRRVSGAAAWQPQGGLLLGHSDR